MSATTDEVLRVLKSATKPMTASEVYNAGTFTDSTIVAVALHDLSQRGVNRPIVRIKPETGGKYQYRIATEEDKGVTVAVTTAAAPVQSKPLVTDIKPVPLIPETPVRPVPKAPMPAPTASEALKSLPTNDGAYAAVLFDMKREREELMRKIVKIDSAIIAIEALT